MFLRENLGPNTSEAKIRRMSLFACLNVDEGSYARLGLSMRFDCFFCFVLCFSLYIKNLKLTLLFPLLLSYGLQRISI